MRSGLLQHANGRFYEDFYRYISVLVVFELRILGSSGGWEVALWIPVPGLLYTLIVPAVIQPV